MARDKEFEWRMQGMVYACKKAKEEGIEALEKDMKMRNFLKADIYTPQKDVEAFWQSTSAVFYNNVRTVAAYSLNQRFGFGKDRLNQFLEEFEKAMYVAQDLNYLGEHFAKLEDYAIYLNDKYKLGLDVSLIAACQDAFDKQDKRYKDQRFLNGIINSLRAHNYHDAANFLEKQKAEVV